jgi:hypothetical protein
MMKPVKAFLYQDHQAHIAVHMSAMQDPKIIALLQNNPMAPQLQAAMMAHINEHLGFEYRKQIELQLGMPLPPQKDESGEDVHMSPEVEARLAPMLAMAAQRLVQQNQQEAAAQQAQQQQQDPLIQMQQQELQIKQQDLQRKAQKDKSDAQLKAAQIQIENKRIDEQSKYNLHKLNADQTTKGVELGAKYKYDNQKLKADQIQRGIEIGLDAEKNKQQMELQRQQIAAQQNNRNKPTKGE